MIVKFLVLFSTVCCEAMNPKLESVLIRVRTDQ